MADGMTRLVSITLPEDWWQAASQLARKRGLTNSELIRELIREALPQKRRQQLSHPTKRGRPRVAPAPLNVR